MSIKTRERTPFAEAVEGWKRNPIGIPSKRLDRLPKKSDCAVLEDIPLQDLLQLAMACVQHGSSRAISPDREYRLKKIINFLSEKQSEGADIPGYDQFKMDVHALLPHLSAPGDTFDNDRLNAMDPEGFIP